MTDASSSARHLALVGPTASGKSALAHAVAVALGDVEIISVDSMQVYRGMDIGTAKPSRAEQQQVPYHLLDVVDPYEEFSVGRYQREVSAALADITCRGRRALLVGGTGLYLQAIIDRLRLPGRYPDVRAVLEAEPDTSALFVRLVLADPLAASRMEPSNRRRIIRALEVCVGSGKPFSSCGPGLSSYSPVDFDLVALAWPRPALDDRVTQRYTSQLADGFLDEVRALAARPRGLGRTASQALGYRELLGHLAGLSTLDAAVDDAVRRTRRFARRQERWFRRDPRIRWIEVRNNPMVVFPCLLRDWSSCT
jgi:tRNA dimethylallyltransferase